MGKRMRSIPPRITLSALCALAVSGALGVGLWPGAAPRPAGPLPEADSGLGAAGGPKARRLYGDWRRTHEALGGDRNVAIALGAGRGAARPDRPWAHAAGLARLDLVAGRARIEVQGLPRGEAWDAWLIDKVPGGADRRVRLGPLAAPSKEGAPAVLEADLGAARGDFDVDVVAVAPAGAEPKEEAGALVGMPTAFQRLYSAERRGQLLRYALEAAPLLRRGPAGPGARLGDELAALSRGGVATAAPTAVDADVVVDSMVAAGAQLFINETFGGNGRTCASCHPPGNNFTLDPAFIAALPPSDPLFVAEQRPELAQLEDSALLRSRALITENVDGFDKPGVLRSVNHTFALSQTIGAPACVDPSGCNILIPGAPPLHFDYGQQVALVDNALPVHSGFPPVAVAPTFLAYPLQRTGWGGDGAPGSGTLREFAIGAVRQHLPRTLARVAGVDFRLPTDAELDALELFQLSLGRIEELNLRKLAFKDSEVERGKQIFITSDTQNGTVQAGKCEICHFNAGARSTPEVFGAVIAKFGVPSTFDGNNLFSTGVNALTAADGALPRVGPKDAGFGLLPLAAGSCVNGTVDVSGPAPVFTPVPGSEPGGFASIATPGVLPAGLCMEAFNVPPLVEAADTPPFFHNNAVDTLEKAVATYNSAAFNQDPQIRLFMTFTDSGKIGIQLTDASVKAIAKMLRTLNALENLRQSGEQTAAAAAAGSATAADELVDQAHHELKDARAVLHAVSLYPGAALRITQAIALNRLAAAAPLHGPIWRQLLAASRAAMGEARDLMVRQLP